MNEALSQSGRTTRLVEHACKAAWAGRAVYLLAHNDKYARELALKVDQTWKAMCGKDAHGIKCENMQHWERHRLWDWHTMEPMSKSFHPNSLFLVDHFAVEQKLAEVQANIKYLAELAGKLYPHTV